MNIEIKNFKGCYHCPLGEKGESCNCMDYNVPVRITFTKNEKADYWGRIVTVFHKGEIVEGYAVIKDGIAYCVSAYTDAYGGYQDFIDPENADIELI